MTKTDVIELAAKFGIELSAQQINDMDQLSDSELEQVVAGKTAQQAVIGGGRGRIVQQVGRRRR